MRSRVFHISLRFCDTLEELKVSLGIGELLDLVDL